MKDGKIIKFLYDKVEYAYYLNNEIVVYNAKEGTEKIIPMSNVKKVYVKKFNEPATVIFTALGLVVLYFAVAFIGFITSRHVHNPIK